MRKTKLILIGLIAAFLALNTLPALAQGERGKRGGEGYKERLAKELNLTQVQETKLAENRKAQRAEMQKLGEAIRQKHEQLSQALKDQNVTMATVQPLVNEIKSLQAQLTDIRINGIFAVKAILTPEQFAKFQQITEKQQKNRKGHFQKGREKKIGATQN
jgi:Spy/CpxP family protein refolding chaperone